MILDLILKLCDLNKYMISPRANFRVNTVIKTLKHYIPKPVIELS